ncbi:DUF6504 family protein [Ornithinimicrobium cryptoxanthini]|uniref:DUF6504 family protein n=1 Tax=Ornithinimicrobium cryptoxanthini TaxID=2934161 RepID=A0ABY4YLI6_9MICO|nr:DUF6504 family protein [Ornithinimicrobium cryptoxanthini]USQ77573.1 DUF6504 family protein [Ornithinimicrobium cryptoxanthini]
MSRRYADPVEVRVGEPQIGLRPAMPAGVDIAAVPTAFIWRGRLHIVQVVLDHWTQRLPWWRGSVDGPTADDPTAGGPAADGGAAGGGAVEETQFPELERQVWRVEASAGRLMQTGVYDLTKDDRWRLVRVAD